MHVFHGPQIAAVYLTALWLVPMAAANAQEPKPGQNQSDVLRLIEELGDPEDEAAEKAILSLEKVGLVCVDPLFHAFEKSDNLTRTRVVQVLGLLRHTAIKENRDALSTRIEDLLVKALDDSHLPVIGCSAMALSFKEPRSKKAIPVLISNLRREQRNGDRADAVSASAFVALRRYGPDAAEGFPVFLEIFTNAKNSEPRRLGAGVTLASVAPKDSRAVAALTKAVRSDKERLEFRTQVASIMVRDLKDGAQGIMGDVFGILEATTDKRKDPMDYSSVRSQLTRALGLMKLTKREITYLAGLLCEQSEAPLVRIYAAEGIGNAAPASAYTWPYLIKMVERETSPDPLCVSVIAVVGKMGPAAKDAKGALERLASTTDYEPLKDEIKSTLKKIQGP